MRCSRAISVATSAGSPRSQPSEMTITTPLERSARRAQRRLNSRKRSPIRVPPAQSVTASATRARARSRSRSRSRRVTRVSRVPNTNDSVRTSDDAESAWMNRSSSREWRSIEPEMSQRTTSGRGRRTWRRQTQSVSCPPVARLRRNIARGREEPAVVVKLERRVRRIPRRGASRSTSRSASRSSAARHPVEVLVAQDLARGAVGIGRSHLDVRRRRSSSLLALGPTGATPRSRASPLPLAPRRRSARPPPRSAGPSSGTVGAGGIIPRQLPSPRRARRARRRGRRPRGRPGAGRRWPRRRP